MALGDTAAAIQRTVDARFEAFKAALDRAIEIYGHGGNPDDRLQAFVPVALTAQNLHDVLHEKDRPQWLGAILNASRTFRDNPHTETSKRLLNTIISQSKDIKPIKLVAESIDEFKFDSIFEMLREKHHLPEIFDRLAAELTQIIESGEIDSSVTIAALQKMVAALRANRKGSQSSMEVSFSYVRFAWNYAGELLKRIPGVQEFTTAVEKTIAEGEAEMTALREDMRDEALAALVASVPNIKKIPTYATQVPLLTSERTPAANGDVDVVDADFEVKSTEP